MHIVDNVSITPIIACTWHKARLSPPGKLNQQYALCCIEFTIERKAVDLILLKIQETSPTLSLQNNLSCSCIKKPLRRLIFIHLQCWEVLPFGRFQRQRCIKVRVLRAQDFYTPLALKMAKGQHLPALEVYKNQSSILAQAKSRIAIFTSMVCIRSLIVTYR